MQTRWVAVLVLGVAIVAGCKRKPEATEPAPEAPTPNLGNTVVPAIAKPTAKNGRGTFTVGKSTTYVTGPVDANGRIDYAAALNERLKKGATPENNANVLLWKALGPRPAGEKVPPAFFEQLGIPVPPAHGEYFIGAQAFAAIHPDSGLGPLDAALTKVEALTKRPWTADQQPGVSAWLTANAKPLALVVEATNRPRYYRPLIPPSDEKGSKGLVGMLWPELSVCREIVAALASRAMLHAGHGRAEAAWQDLLACHRLARLLGSSATLLEALVGMAIEQIACRGDVALLGQAKLDAKSLESCLAQLRSLPPLTDLAEKWDLCERCWTHDSIMQLDHRGVGGFPFFDLEEGDLKHGLSDDLFDGIDWNPVLERANKGYDRLVALLRETDRATRIRKLDQFMDELRPLREQFVRGQAPAALRNAASASERGRVFGEMYCALGGPSMRKMHDAAERTTQLRENVVTAYALAWYERVNGRYPNTLDALAPKYLPQVPKDLFTGGALVYKPTADGYLLYSVGPDGKDDGGNTKDNQPAGDDLVVRMPPR
jgi:hypothetical protein